MTTVRIINVATTITILFTNYKYRRITECIEFTAAQSNHTPANCIAAFGDEARVSEWEAWVGFVVFAVVHAQTVSPEVCYS